MWLLQICANHFFISIYQFESTSFMICPLVNLGLEGDPRNEQLR